MSKYLKCVLFIYPLGLSQPSSEHRTFMKGSEEPPTSVHAREQQEMEKVLTGFLNLPSELGEYTPHCGSAKHWQSPTGREEQQLLWEGTCDVELDLQHHFVGERRVPQELVGLLHGAVLRRDAVDGKDSVAYLQQATPAVHSGKRGNGNKETRKKREGGRKQPHNQPWVTFARQICCKTHKVLTYSAEVAPKRK